MQQKEMKIEDLNEQFLETLEKEKIIKIATQIFILMSKDSGYGFGICSFGNMMRWNIRREKKDWGSIVGTKVPLERYTKEDLIKMLLFAQKVTTDYDKYFRIRQGANIVILNKDDSRTYEKKPFKQWMLKRLSWESGKFYHDNLDEAIEFFLNAESKLD